MLLAAVGLDAAAVACGVAARVKPYKCICDCQCTSQLHGSVTLRDADAGAHALAAHASSSVQRFTLIPQYALIPCPVPLQGMELQRSAGVAAAIAAAKRQKLGGTPSEPETPFYRGLKLILAPSGELLPGCRNLGWLCCLVSSCHSARDSGWMRRNIHIDCQTCRCDMRQ